jgi:hypothetical protein
LHRTQKPDENEKDDDAKVVKDGNNVGAEIDDGLSVGISGYEHANVVLEDGDNEKNLGVYDTFG